MNPKYIITDYINDGIVFVGSDLAVANQLKLGLLDTRLFVVHAANPNFNLFDEEDFFANDRHFFINPVVSYEPKPLPDHMKYPVYMERRQLVKIRKPIMEQLMRHCAFSSYLCSPTPWPGIENNLEFALKDCNVDIGVYSDAVQEYAFIHKLENYHAYKELKLLVENIHSMKLRSYSYMKYFVDKINQVLDIQQQKEVSSEMITKFVRDGLM